MKIISESLYNDTLGLFSVPNYIMVIYDLDNDPKVTFIHNSKQSILFFDPTKLIAHIGKYDVINLADIRSCRLRLELRQVQNFYEYNMLLDKSGDQISAHLIECHSVVLETLKTILDLGVQEINHYYNFFDRYHYQIFNYVDNSTGNSLIHSAVEKNNISLVSLLIDLDIDINAINNENKTALALACELCNNDICNLLISNGADIMIPDVDDWYPIHHAIYSGVSFDNIKNLTFDLSTKNFTLCPLDLAAHHSSKPIVKHLVENSANINSTDIMGKTPIISSLNNKDQDVVYYLLSTKPDCNKLSSEGYSFALYALLQGKLCHRMISSGLINLNLSFSNGYTLLLIACIFEDLDTIKLLIEHGADCRVVSSHSLSLYEIAVLIGSDTITNYIIENISEIAHPIGHDKILFFKEIFNKDGLDIVKTLLCSRFENTLKYGNASPETVTVVSPSSSSNDLTSRHFS